MSTEIDFVLLIVVLFAVFLPVTAKFPGIFLFLQFATLRFSLFYLFFSLCTTLAADKDVVSLFFALLLLSLSIFRELLDFPLQPFWHCFRFITFHVYRVRLGTISRFTLDGHTFIGTCCKCAFCMFALLQLTTSPILSAHKLQKNYPSL